MDLNWFSKSAGRNSPSGVAILASRAVRTIRRRGEERRGEERREGGEEREEEEREGRRGGEE